MGKVTWRQLETPSSMPKKKSSSLTGREYTYNGSDSNVIAQAHKNDLLTRSESHEC